jgi:hypothetical protein
MDDPVATLDEVRRVRARTRRRAHGGAWFPAAVLAALVLGSVTLYRSPGDFPFVRFPGQEGRFLFSTDILYPFWAGLPEEQRSAAASYAYWLIGLPLAFAAIAWWYRHRAGRVGVRVPWRVFAGVGLGVLLLIVVLLAIPSPRRADPNLLTSESGPYWWHGLTTPLLAVAASLIALGWVERAPGLGVAGAWLGLLAWWQAAAGYGTIPGWLDWLLNGGSGPGIGGTVELPPAGMLVLLVLPVLAWIAVAAVAGARRLTP